MELTIDYLAEILQTGLNANSNNYKFDIKAYTNDTKDKIKSEKRVQDKKIISGVLSVITSEIVPILEIGQSYISTILRIPVSSDYFTEVYNLVQKYIQLNIGSQQSVDNYKIIISFQFPQAMQNKIDQYKVNTPLELICNFKIIQNGVTFSDTELYVDGNKLKFLSMSMAPIKTEDPSNPINSETTMLSYKSQCIAITVSLPYLADDTIKMLFDDVFKYKRINKVYEIKYIDSLHKGTDALVYKMSIKNMPMAVEPLKNNGFNLTFMEAREDLEG